MVDLRTCVSLDQNLEASDIHCQSTAFAKRLTQKNEFDLSSKYKSAGCDVRYMDTWMVHEHEQHSYRKCRLSLFSSCSRVASGDPSWPPPGPSPIVGLRMNIGKTSSDINGERDGPFISKYCSIESLHHRQQCQFYNVRLSTNNEGVGAAMNRRVPDGSGSTRQWIHLRDWIVSQRLLLRRYRIATAEEILASRASLDTATA